MIELLKQVAALSSFPVSKLAAIARAVQVSQSTQEAVPVLAAKLVAYRLAAHFAQAFGPVPLQTAQDESQKALQTDDSCSVVAIVPVWATVRVLPPEHRLQVPKPVAEL